MFYKDFLRLFRLKECKKLLNVLVALMSLHNGCNHMNRCISFRQFFASADLFFICAGGCAVHKARINLTFDDISSDLEQKRFS